jgi:hypothetical protein
VIDMIEAYRLPLEWISLGLSLALVLGYEWSVRRRAVKAPLTVAQSTNALIRENWVRSLMGRPGQEILAVQTIRNSVMSSTITASTAVLALMGAIAHAIATIPDDIHAMTLISMAAHGVNLILASLLLLLLFGAFVLSAMAVRFYNHAGYIMSTISITAKQWRSPSLPLSTWCVPASTTV